jgi:hypothetical protein
VNTKIIKRAAQRSALRLALLIGSAALVLMTGGCATMGYSRPEPVTVPQIVSMAKSGVPADDIIAKIKASGTVYRLKASQLADLENEGVPAKVIDYMQKTYLDAVKRDTRYEDRQYWTMDHDYWYGGDPYGWADDGGDWDDRGDRDD